MIETRRLAAILAADVVGYSRLMGADEEGTHERVKVLLKELVNPTIEEYRGRIVKNTGDGMLVEFSSIVDALRCAVKVQRGMADRNRKTPDDKRITFRIGINIGDVIVEPEDIYGDGVNVAARLEGVAEPGGICISDDAFRQVQGKVDVEFIDIGEQTLKNIARPLRAYLVSLGTTTDKQAPSALAAPDKPSIAVLPFQNMSGDPEQEYFADGMVEEIITALSRIRWLFVIARNSSFTYRGKTVDVKQVARELGVRYVLEGSVRKGGNRVRITAQLIEAATGSHLWADRFDGSLENVFELQDKIAISVAGVIEPALKLAEIRRSSERRPSDISGYDLYLRALHLVYAVERAGYLRALDLLKGAIERDADYGPALSLAAYCHHCLHVSGWTDDLETARREGIELARRALRFSGDDAETLARVACVLGYFGEDIDAAIALIGHSVELNPNFAPGWFWSGWLRLWAGQAEIAIQHFETALRLNPRDPHPSSLIGIGVSQFFAGRFEEARATLFRALQQLPVWVPTYRFLAACCAHLGRHDEARDMITQLRALTAVVMPTAEHWRKPEYRELYLSGLRLAIGGEEASSTQSFRLS